jgi:hypothetical protein
VGDSSNLHQHAHQQRAVNDGLVDVEDADAVRREHARERARQAGTILAGDVKKDDSLHVSVSAVGRAAVRPIVHDGPAGGGRQPSIALNSSMRSIGPMTCIQPPFMPGRTRSSSLQLTSPFCSSHRSPDTGAKSMPKLLRRP